MTNSLMTNQIRNPKFESKTPDFIISIGSFVLSHSFVIGHSSFGFRHCPKRPHSGGNY